MNINTIRKRAKKMDIEPGTMDKKDLIRSIQEKEGNTPCFKSEPPSCDQYDCCWRDDCRPGELIGML